MDVTTLHRRAVEVWTDRVSRVGEGQWHLPTPCTEWDVRTLVNHLVYEERWTVPLMNGATLAEVGDAFEGDLLGEEPVGAARAAAEEAVAAAGPALAEGRTVHLSAGPAPAREYAYELAADHLVHAWDLAAATGGDRSLPDDLVEAVAAWFIAREQAYREAGMIAEAPETAPGASPQERLLAAFGREAGWAPPGS